MSDRESVFEAAFEAEVAELREQVIELRAALAQISSLRRENFTSGFAYEVSVRKQADAVLQRWAPR